MWFPRSRRSIFQSVVAAISQYWKQERRDSRFSQPRSRRQSKLSDDRGALVQALEPRVMLTIDLGDAPSPYPTTLAENGARHEDTGPTLGASRDSELDGTHSAAATADDTTGIDDESGVTFGTLQVGVFGATATVNVSGGAALLDAWVDFNGDGNWGGLSEQIFASQAVVVGVNNLTFDVPGWAIDGTTFARFRLSTAGSLGPEGLAANGEVEDYAVTITPPAIASGNFGTQNTISTSAVSPRSVFAVDMDGDGDVDVVSASGGGDMIEWYENNGLQNFLGHTISTAASDPRSVTAADVDGDGDMDVLSASTSDNKIAWYENDGSQNFAAHTISTAARSARSVTAADVDGDGDIDVLSASYRDDKIAWYENNGSQVFTARNVNTPDPDADSSNGTNGNADGAQSVFAADVDGDGDLDVLSASSNDDKIAWYENDGNQNFTARTISTAADFASKVFAADMDGDGDMDVLSDRGWYENDGNQNFAARTISTAFAATSVIAADVDGDGDMDVLSTSFNVEWYENDGFQNFTAHTVNHTAVNSPASVAVADMDGDGDLDVVSTSFVDDNIAWYDNLPPDPNLVVTTTADTVNALDGVISLREAILFSNSNAGLDEIDFNIPGAGVQTISVTSPLPDITDAVIIDGSSQGVSAMPLIELNGTGAGAGAVGLKITAGGSTVKGLVINRFNGVGILLVSGGGNSIVGNFIGTNAAGTADLGNAGEGVHIYLSGSNTIGGTTAATRNLISGNDRNGVAISGASNVVLGNLIGTNLAGTAALANSFNGIVINSNANTIGGSVAAARNVISGNAQRGVYISGGGGNVVWGNYIGTDLTGTADLGNALSGVHLDNGAASNTIGGTQPERRNIISGNNEYGVRLQGFGTTINNSVQGNYIGTNASGTAAIGNSLSGVQVNATSNTIGGAIFSNGGGNLISGNGQHGVLIQGGANAANVVSGNRIGTTPNGAARLGNLLSGVQILNSTGNTIGGTTPNDRNLISGNNENGVHLTGASTANNVVRANYIGTDLAGTGDLGNTLSGIWVVSANNTIGGTAASYANVISGNDRFGISIQGVGSTGNTVQGNRIGTNPTGTAAIGNSLSGVMLYDAGSNTIGGTVAGARNLISGNVQHGVYLTQAGTTSNLIQGNYIGTDINATADLGNTLSGVTIDGRASSNTIGGTAAGARNIISGNNQHGVYLLGFGGAGVGTRLNLVQGNYIGTNIIGTSDLGNTLNGVQVQATANTIGGTAAGAGNVISGNDQNGVNLQGGANANTLVQGNRIGAQANGTSALANSQNGVQILNSTGNTVGGTAAGSGNTIAFNTQDGVAVAGASSATNSILGNSTFSNGDLGIDLNTNGFTPNDVDDSDTGPNNLQNFPVFASVVLNGANLDITYSVPSIAPNSIYPLRIEFYIADANDQEGKTFLGSDNYAAPGAKLATISAGAASVGTRIVATATDANGNTSEFSAFATVG